MRAEEVIQAVAELCRHFSAVEVILFGSRAKGTARERSDIDVTVSGVKDFDALAEQIEELPTLYSIDLFVIHWMHLQKQNSGIFRILLY